MKNSGITRNKINILFNFRQEIKLRKTVNSHLNSFDATASRFSKSRLGGQHIELVEVHDNLSKPFVDDLSTNSTIDQPKPLWLAYFDECKMLIKSVLVLRGEMAQAQKKRLSCVRVNEQKKYQVKIYQCAKEATERVKKCQRIVENIQRQGSKEHPVQAKVCKSICASLSWEIQEQTKLLRGQQKSFVDQRRQFEETEKASFLELAADHILNNSTDIMQGQFIEDEVIVGLEERNQQITKIVSSIYQLNTIYKQLGELVLLQGSLLDRIDSNIQTSHNAVISGRQHLQKAEKHQKKASRCACIVISVQMTGIVILLIILMNKWMK